MNHGPVGADFGWPCYEGNDVGSLAQPGYSARAECQSYYTTDNAIAPAYSYEHVSGIGGAIVVGEYYTHSKWPSPYQQRLFLADYASQTISFATVSGNGVQVSPFATDILTVDLVFGPDGDLYTTDVTTGIIGRIVYQIGGFPNELNLRIVSQNDDAEEAANGAMDLGSSDLEMVDDGTQQQIGLRFNNVNVPQGATFDEANIQFTADELDTELTSL